VRGASLRWRVKTSNTQPKQSQFSATLTDSGGKADRSRAERSFVGFGCFTARLETEGLLSVGRFGGVEALERRAARLAGLRTGLVFPVGVPMFSLTDFPISHSLV
jgi:hypothetical protein